MRATPAIAGACSGLAFATAPTCTASRWISATRVTRLAFRSDALPTTRVSVLVSASLRSSMADWTSARVGSGDGNHELPDTPSTISRARTRSRGVSYSGSLGTTTYCGGALLEVLTFSKEDTSLDERAARRRTATPNLVRRECGRRSPTPNLVRCERRRRSSTQNDAWCDSGRRSSTPNDAWCERSNASSADPCTSSRSCPTQRQRPVNNACVCVTVRRCISTLRAPAFSRASAKPVAFARRMSSG